MHEPHHRLLHARYAAFPCFSFLFVYFFSPPACCMQEASGGEKINSPPRWAAHAGPARCWPSRHVWAGPGPDRRSYWADLGPNSFLGRDRPVVFLFIFYFGLSPAHLFGPAQPELFLYYLLYIIYYNVLIYVCICE